VNELVTWLRAQLDEDERVARAADAGRWLPEDKGITFEYRADDFHEGEAQARLVADSRANQYHIASWDPARVLAEVDAKRQMLDLADRLAADADDAAMGTHPEEAVTLAATARFIRATVALPYADQPGYRDEWRPA
jgi:hypothetical protein